MPKVKETWEPVSEDQLRRVAHIVGPYSAAADALAEAKARRAEGETVEFFTVKRGRSTYTVVKGSK